MTTKAVIEALKTALERALSALEDYVPHKEAWDLARPALRAYHTLQSASPPPTGDVVEAVARAICIGIGDDPDREGERLTGYDEAARQAIAALQSADPRHDALVDLPRLIELQRHGAPEDAREDGFNAGMTYAADMVREALTPTQGEA